MIYVRLHGGLGNQLFQYAVGRALALRRGTEVALDPRDALKKQAAFHPALHHFAVVHAGAVPLPPGRDRPLAYALWRYAGLRSGRTGCTGRRLSARLFSKRTLF